MRGTRTETAEFFREFQGLAQNSMSSASRRFDPEPGWKGEGWEFEKTDTHWHLKPRGQRKIFPILIGSKTMVASQLSSKLKHLD
jgi:hypothetical protein